jgi:hypothetical protein
MNNLNRRARVLRRGDLKFGGWEPFANPVRQDVPDFTVNRRPGRGAAVQLSGHFTPSPAGKGFGKMTSGPLRVYPAWHRTGRSSKSESRSA